MHEVTKPAEHCQGRVPLQAGKREQPQKELPAFLPRLATRRTIRDPHRGHVCAVDRPAAGGAAAAGFAAGDRKPVCGVAVALIARFGFGMSR